MNTANPNDIIAALLDIASAAFSVNHCVSAEGDGQECLRRLDLALNKLDGLPQIEPGGHLTKTALARHYLASFVAGETITPDKMRSARMARAFEVSMKQVGDAELLEDLRLMCGYVENGTADFITIGQDDATHEWMLRTGDSLARQQGRGRTFGSSSFHQVIRLAADEMKVREKHEAEMAELRNMQPPKPAPALRDMRPPKPAPAAPNGALVTARREMNVLMLRVKEEGGVQRAKQIVLLIGKARKMIDIDDNLIAEVTSACNACLSYWALDKNLQRLQQIERDERIEREAKEADEL